MLELPVHLQVLLSISSYVESFGFILPTLSLGMNVTLFLHPGAVCTTWPLQRDIPAVKENKTTVNSVKDGPILKLAQKICGAKQCHKACAVA